MDLNCDKIIQFFRATWVFSFSDLDTVEMLRDDCILPDSNVYLYSVVRENTVKIFEAYKAGINLPLIVKIWGLWSSLKGLELVNNSTKWARRSDLSGVEITATFIENPPFFVFEKNATLASGYFGEVWNTLQEVLKFNGSIFPTADGNFGALDSNGKWNGVIGTLVRKEADVSICALSVSKERAEFVDFLPVIQTNM